MTEQTKFQQTLVALKGANKHLEILLSHINTSDVVAGSVASDLRYLAARTGDLRATVFVGNEQKTISLKDHLNSLAVKLEGSRS